MRLTLPKPDDLHIHVRDGEVLASVVPATAEVFGRALCMPNLKPPVRTAADAVAYRDRIRAAAPAGSGFEPLMTLYLTDATRPADLRAAAEVPGIVGCKLYPAGATTNADHGVRDPRALNPEVYATMSETGLVLQVHGEVTHADVDVFDREARFIEEVAEPLLEQHPGLRMVFEHATTSDAVAFVRRHDAARVGCTITPQHLLLDRNALFAGGLRPHVFCLPVLKRGTHRVALMEAATSGDPRFFLGTDSAPHARGAKESACGCAGCYTAPHALALYAWAFEGAGALDRLADFASRFGAAFYGLPPNEGTVTLVREPTPVPASFPMGDTEVVPLFAGETIPWRLAFPEETA
jgi:dihydroorotase